MNQTGYPKRILNHNSKQDSRQGIQTRDPSKGPKKGIQARNLGQESKDVSKHMQQRIQITCQKESKKTGLQKRSPGKAPRKGIQKGGQNETLHKFKNGSEKKSKRTPERHPKRSSERNPKTMPTNKQQNPGRCLNTNRKMETQKGTKKESQKESQKKYGIKQGNQKQIKPDK